MATSGISLPKGPGDGTGGAGSGCAYQRAVAIHFVAADRHVIGGAGPGQSDRGVENAGGM